MNPTTKILILASALLCTATVAQAGGRCFHAEIPQSMVLPDGSTHAPGGLRICLEQTISPASTLHRGDVGGRPVGMFLSAPRPIELTVEDGKAQFVFKKTIDDELALIGYAVTEGDETTFFDLGRYVTERAANRYPVSDWSGDEVAVVLIAGR